MKRKIKIFSAIASLTLAVALMAFGVYAATTVSYTVSGTVQYVVKDVIATITTTVDYATTDTDGTKGEVAGNVTETIASGYKNENWKSVTFDNGKAWTTYTTTGDVKQPLPTATKDASGVAVDFNTSTVWRISITISNDAKQGAKAITIAPGLFTKPTNVNILAKGSNVLTSAVGAPTTIVYYVTIQDLTLNIAKDTAFSMPFTLSLATA